jgi:hypothetical protein
MRRNLEVERKDVVLKRRIVHQHVIARMRIEATVLHMPRWQVFASGRHPAFSRSAIEKKLPAGLLFFVSKRVQRTFGVNRDRETKQAKQSQ